LALVSECSYFALLFISLLFGLKIINYET
jgi:hypothetical protein